MTQDKAREYFSAYHEGALEPGLAASLERKFEAEPGLRDEYEAFSATILALDALKTEAIEVPFYLNDRISARLDHVQVAPQPFWANWFKPQAAGSRSFQPVWVLGVAACLLVASFGLRGMQANGAKADFIPVTSASDSVKCVETDGGVLFSMPGSSEAQQVVVTAAGGEAKSYDLQAGQSFELTLTNANADARRFEIRSGKALIATVAVPGSRKVARKAGSGTVTEMASAIAETYGVPVVVKVSATGAALHWKFESADALSAAEEGLANHGMAMTPWGATGVVQIR